MAAARGSGVSRSRGMAPIERGASQCPEKTKRTHFRRFEQESVWVVMGTGEADDGRESLSLPIPSPLKQDHVSLSYFMYSLNCSFRSNLVGLGTSDFD